MWQQTVLSPKTSTDQDLRYHSSVEIDFKGRNIEAYNKMQTHLSAVRIRRQDWKISGTKSEWKFKGWRKKGSVHHPRQTSSSVKHFAGSVMAWTYSASTGTDLLFIDDVTLHCSSRINSDSDIYRFILSGNIQRNVSNLIVKNFTTQHDNDPKHIGTITMDAFGGKVESFRVKG